MNKGLKDMKFEIVIDTKPNIKGSLMVSTATRSTKLLIVHQDAIIVSMRSCLFVCMNGDLSGERKTGICH